jgi:hypothetical protein
MATWILIYVRGPPGWSEVMGLSVAYTHIRRTRAVHDLVPLGQRHVVRLLHLELRLNGREAAGQMLALAAVSRAHGGARGQQRRDQQQKRNRPATHNSAVLTQTAVLSALLGFTPEQIMDAVQGFAGPGIQNADGRHRPAGVGKKRLPAACPEYGLKNWQSLINRTSFIGFTENR